MRKLEFILAVALTVPGSGCGWFRKAPPPPPAPKPAGQDIIPPKPKGKPAVIPAPPPVAGTTSGVPPTTEPPVVEVQETEIAAPPPAPAPPKPTPTRRRARATPPVKQESGLPQGQTGSAGQSVPPGTTAAPEKPVQLGELMQDDQKAEYEKAYQENVQEAQRALTLMQGRTLTSEQEEERSRVQNFLMQAKESHAGDLRNAVQLSKRAAVLALELEKTIR